MRTVGSNFPVRPLSGRCFMLRATRGNPMSSGANKEESDKSADEKGGGGSSKRKEEADSSSGRKKNFRKLSKCNTNSASCSLLIEDTKEADLFTIMSEIQYRNLISVNPDEIRVQLGDMIDNEDLLFTPDRDYLVKNNNIKVKASDLAGKVVVIFFARLCRPFFQFRQLNDLIEIYKQLLGKGCFEVVLVAIRDDYEPRITPNYFATEEECKRWFDRDALERFNEIFNLMPWPAVPYSDHQTRETARIKLIRHSNNIHQTSFILDPCGMVLESTFIAEHVFYRFGADGFPFTCERCRMIKFGSNQRITRGGYLSLSQIISTQSAKGFNINDVARCYWSRLDSSIQSAEKSSTLMTCQAFLDDIERRLLGNC